MNIAFLGTGIMGSHMAGHLIKAGHDLTVFNRTRSKADGLIAQGARWADSPSEAADGQDVAISIVGMPEDVESVYLGPQGVCQASAPPRSGRDRCRASP